MVDTIRIKIYAFQTVKDNPCFSEKKGSVFTDRSGKQHVNRYIETNNQWRSEMQAQGRYVPLYHTETSSFQQGGKYLVLEFSVPKFLQGHSLAHVSERDLDKLVTATMDFCKTISVSVARRDILSAVVARVDYCKNVQVGEYGTAQEVMKILSGFPYRYRSTFQPKYSAKSELTHMEYFNTTSHFVVYDKLMEMAEHARTTQEQDLVHLIKKGLAASSQQSMVTPTVRFELSLHNTVAVSQAMRQFYNKKPSYTLEDVFKDHIAEVLLRAEVRDTYNHPLKAVSVNAKHDFRNINKKVQAFLDTKHTDRKLRAVFEQAVVILHAEGWAALREHFKKDCSKRTFARRIAELRELEALGIGLDTPNEKVLEHILRQFGIIDEKITTPGQQSLF